MNNFPDLIRIGSKLVSRKKINENLEKIFSFRKLGYSQEETARKLSVERPFVSQLEKLGEVRKGGRIAVIGFPIENKEEITRLAEKAGAEYLWVMTDEERWNLIEGATALDFFNYLMEQINYLKELDSVVLITSERWYQLASALLNNQLIFISLGHSPLQGNCRVEPERLSSVLEEILDGMQGRRDT